MLLRVVWGSKFDGPAQLNELVSGKPGHFSLGGQQWPSLLCGALKGCCGAGGNENHPGNVLQGIAGNGAGREMQPGGELERGCMASQ
jgi:hypothetical protein